MTDALAVKTVGGAPLQTVLAPVMFTVGFGFTVMLMLLLVAGLFNTQKGPPGRFDSKVQVTTSPLASVDVVYVFRPMPNATGPKPLTNHS